MRLIIEVVKLNSTDYEARLIGGDIELNDNYTLSFKGKSVDDASFGIRTFLNNLGYKGEFVVRYVEEKVYPAPNINSKTIKIPSNSRPGLEHTVTYNPIATRPDLPYTCTCEHFRYRIAEEGGHCNHTSKARFEYGLGL